MTHAIYVAGLGYGDEGKGTTIDALARQHNSKLVVRYNGGAQAGHNVVMPDGRHHCFSQFGSGTIAGASTHLSRYMLVNPVTLISEAKHLSSIGISDPFTALTIHEEALITTPFHMAANRIKEMERSGMRHGSCGMGIGETMSDSLSVGSVVIRVRDLKDPIKLRALLLQQQETKREQIRRAYERACLNASAQSQLTTEWDILDKLGTIDKVLEACAFVADKARFVCDEFLDEQFTGRNVVLFEGAQGVLLDQSYGFQPHTTWTDITFRNAKALTPSDIPAQRLGILRSFMTRHGAGPLVTECERPVWKEGDHNVTNAWQQNFRVGFLDLVVARYAIDVLGGVDGIVMTHLDKPLEPWVDHYRLRDGLPDPAFFDLAGEWVKAIRWNASPTFQRQERLTSALRPLKAVLASEDLTDDPLIYARSFAHDLGTKVVMTSTGKTFEDKTLY
jgi:adenylosuccinate synthase